MHTGQGLPWIQDRSYHGYRTGVTMDTGQELQDRSYHGYRTGVTMDTGQELPWIQDRRPAGHRHWPLTIYLLTFYLLNMDKIQTGWVVLTAYKNAHSTKSRGRLRCVCQDYILADANSTKCTGPRYLRPYTRPVPPLIRMSHPVIPETETVQSSCQSGHISRLLKSLSEICCLFQYKLHSNSFHHIIFVSELFVKCQQWLIMCVPCKQTLWLLCCVVDGGTCTPGQPASVSHTVMSQLFLRQWWRCIS